jgi:hypothetical protein
MLTRKTMKPLLVLCLLVFGLTSFNGLSAQAPIANAGLDQTIYLTQTNSVTLNGSGSTGDSYQWTEVSTDYKSGATITSPNSAVTTVTGLPQGVFYFQLAVTSGGSTATDVVVVNVNYDVAPNGTLIHWFDMKANSSIIDDRHDTTSYFSPSTTYGKTGSDPNRFYLFRDRLNGLRIDDQGSKLYSLIQDGYAGTGYPRAEVMLADGNFTIDTLHTYTFEWKGYFPQNTNYLTSWYQILTMFQIHSFQQTPTVFGFDLDASGNIILGDVYDDYSGKDYGKGAGLLTTEKNVATLQQFYDQAHTIRVTVREGKGYAGQSAFLKCEIDGVTVYNRTTGQVGSTYYDDYVKFGGLYDWNSQMVSGSQLSRGRQFSLVTEAFNVYSLSNNKPPKANAGSNQIINLPQNNITLSGSGSDEDGNITSYDWTKSSGPSGETITSPNSPSTSVNNLTQGTYVFQLKVTDNNGATATSTVQITVNAQQQNAIPKASAGADQTITLPTNTVNLIGSGSDSDGTVTAYLWTKTNGPSGGTITSPNLASTSISNLQQGEYTFQLKVTDNAGATGIDTMHVTVNAAPNQSPIANAGNDQNIVLPVNTTTLTGSGTDSDGSIGSYEWTEISGNSCTISNPDSATTTINGLTSAGNYQFQLTVTDNQGATGKDTVLVSVKAGANIIPTASAGADQTITLPTNSVNLTGSGADTDGTIASYSWTKTSGPTATISNASSATTNVTGLVQGTYEFELKVTDNIGAIGKDTVQVTVNVANNIAPTASAGADQTITLPTNTVTLTGTGTDSDGTIASYSWTKTSGSVATITNATSATTAINGLTAGDYTFNLKVTDNQGATGTDTVHVTVKNDTTSSQVVKQNIAPTASAGADQIIYLPKNSVTLTGSGNDSDGTIASYSWTKTSGPTATIANATSATTTINGVTTGDYTFNLKVTDNQGATGTDTVHVIVKNDTTSSQVVKQNIAPTASAGADQTITLPTNTVTLTGTGTDSDGTIASYSWTKTSGPAATITNATSATTAINGLTAGDYTFNLKVTDNQGATGTDTVHVTVKNDTTSSQVVKQNIAPTASAGADQTITLPTNSLILSGTGSDADGTIASYSWTKVSGPSTFSIGNSSASTVNISNLVAGSYQFELKVTDDKGAIGKDTVQVNVISDTSVSQPVKQNLAPTANAGVDQTIMLPTSSVTLIGSGNDSNGTIASYQWTKISGPSATIAAASSATTNVKGLVQGKYQFELKVTDDKGAIGKDTVQITVNSSSSVNIAPTANAGSDITTVSSVQFVTITGSGIDPDGKIKSYSWTEISGPSNATISGSNSATIKIRNLIEGTYQFQLKVTDDKGATGTDTVRVTVALERISSTSTSNVTVNTTSMKVYPNPVHDVATVEITAPSINTDIIIVITDMNGKTVYTDQFVSSSTYVQKQINMSNLIKGTYFVTVYFDGMQQQTVKVIRL